MSLPPLRPSRAPRNRRAASTEETPSAVFWQLVGGASPLFHGPLGEAVGEAAAGTVVREVHRYMDPFGDWWAAARVMDGGLAWMRLSGNDARPNAGQTETASHAKDALVRWQRVFDARDPAAAAEGEVVLCPSVDTHLARHPLPPFSDALCGEAECLARSWRQWRETHEGRDWNTTYQHLIESHLFGTPETSRAAGDALNLFMRDFTDAAEEAAFVVLEDLLRPAAKRVATAIQNVSGAFLAKGLLVRLCMNDAGGGVTGDADVWRVAARGMQARQLLALEGAKRLLATPPSAMVTFAGFRLTVTAIPPIDGGRVVYSALRERQGCLESTETVRSLVMEFGQSIGLQPHTMTASSDDGTKVTTILPIETIVVAGYDRRLYVLNTERLLPPVVSALAPSFGDGNGNEAELRFRPEFLLSWEHPLNCNAFVEQASSSENVTALVDATEKGLRDGLIPYVASMIGMHNAVERPQQDASECTLCTRIMDNELRFVVCRSEDRCCRICSHCYTQRLTEHFSSATSHGKQNSSATSSTGKDHNKIGVRKSMLINGNAKSNRKDVSDANSTAGVSPALEAASLFSDAVKCGAASRRARGLLLEPSITSIFHANGLNMRFLPFVYYSIPQASRFAVAQYCEVEMIARAALHVLRDKLRRTAQTTDEVGNVSQEMLLGLIQSSGAAAMRFWAQELGPKMRQLYGIQEPFDTSEMEVELLCERVAELSGIRLDPASFASLHAEKPFLQLSAVLPKVKTVQPPHVDKEETQQEIREMLLGRLESILLFWIGFADTTKDDSGYDPKTQPFYMTDREDWM